ncbi:hypothetical protein MPL3365_30301 [Mesorhizobium plurifarium]|uniref:Uncharacterized protein n=1 Tax=Mesorhizobium plurifarium TaxID=69974 RepID=A0A090GED1_MESPL|nr:hypothetical protein MPL3365_30301 [Mesorhizobium plurifarium]
MTSQARLYQTTQSFDHDLWVPYVVQVPQITPAAHVTTSSRQDYLLRDY